MHGHSICHCDISPKNIIIATNPDGTERAVLIDFSISSHSSEKFSRFRGTANYVHGQIFLNFLRNQKLFSPSADHDWAGLGFTLVYFANGCICPWDVENFPKSKSQPSPADIDALKSVMMTRLARARSVVEGIELKNEVEELIDCDLQESAYNI